MKKITNLILVAATLLGLTTACAFTQAQAPPVPTDTLAPTDVPATEIVAEAPPEEPPPTDVPAPTDTLPPTPTGQATDASLPIFDFHCGLTLDR